uniref:hypothetical protein n=2 Tax=Argonema antarcticum TaxID=2942763 RepID=UPI0030D7934F
MPEKSKVQDTCCKHLFLYAWSAKMFKFYLKIYFILSASFLLLTGLINWAVDPLWYGKGNRITGRNFSFNERVSKTNFLLQSQPQNYDCLILGSSRVTLLKASSFNNHRCFNYSFSAGRIEEFVEYAKYAKSKGLKPKKVYVGVDAFNFDKSTPPLAGVGKIDPQPIYQAYFSLDVLLFSARTILGFSPDPRYYNQNFESEVIENTPKYKPEFYDREKPSSCNASKIEEYKKLRNVFPQADFVGYVPPISAWNVVNETYGRGLTDCGLQAFYEVSKILGVMYDFSVPSTVTSDSKNTYDGSHFYPEIQNKVTEVLEGKVSNFGVRIDKYNLVEYRQFYKMKLKEFLEKKGQGKRWQG